MCHYKNVSSSPKIVLSSPKMVLSFTKCIIIKNVSKPKMSHLYKKYFKIFVFIVHYFFSETDENTNRPQSPVNQILEAIPAELYVPNQQQWISLKSGSKLATLPFCCR